MKWSIRKAFSPSIYKYDILSRKLSVMVMVVIKNIMAPQKGNVNDFWQLNVLKMLTDAEVK